MYTQPLREHLKVWSGHPEEGAGCLPVHQKTGTETEGEEGRNNDPVRWTLKAKVRCGRNCEGDWVETESQYVRERWGGGRYIGVEDRVGMLVREAGET